ncbi:glycosyltransferase family 39 protein [Streptomyces sp. SID13031]|uniref:glycosyltransferase family 39 protein n=1 Tax=Streptomyces sp. SID13031 TaxID=2706046 RepID=UPI0013C9E80B|nr:glycosyltransferase family 39 protein [Streptomyces sp. SID13031]
MPAFATRPVAGIALLLATVLTALSGRYGFHRDELYFLVAADHLAWGYVDQPPLTPLLVKISTTIFGSTPMGLRVLSTITSALTVAVVALMAREFGNDRRGQVFAALCAALSGFLMGVGHLASTATYDLLAWMVIALLAIKLLRTGGRWWPALGLAVGVALENKYLVVLPLGALLVAVLVLGPRQVLRSWWLPAGIGVALVIAAPNLIWQATNGWPQLTVAGGISEDDGTENRIMFVPLQLLQISPFLVPIWVAGFLRLWRLPTLRWARPVALAYPLLCVVVLALGGKSYYALPLVLVLLAAGAQPTIDWISRSRSRRTTLSVGLVLTALTSALFTLPVVPTSSVNIVIPVNKEQGEQVGWPELAEAVSAAWQTIPADQRPQATLFAGNYGQAGALLKYGPSHGLPITYSGHMSFYDFGRPADTQTGPVLLVEQQRTPEYERHFSNCHQVATFDNTLNVDNEEQGAAIVLCSAPTVLWSTLWPNVRRYY